MAGTYNRCQFIGNLTRDPEVRDAGDQKVTRFGIAVNKKVKGKDDVVQYISCDAWRKTGEICAELLKKGMSVMVVGELNVRKYKKRDSEEMEFSIDLTLDDRQGMVILDKKSDNGSSSNGTTSSSSGSARSNGNGNKSSREEEILEDEIPF